MGCGERRKPGNPEGSRLVHRIVRYAIKRQIWRPDLVVGPTEPKMGYRQHRQQKCPAKDQHRNDGKRRNSYGDSFTLPDDLTGVFGAFVRWRGAGGFRRKYSEAGAPPSVSPFCIYSQAPAGTIQVWGAPIEYVEFGD